MSDKKIKVVIAINNMIIGGAQKLIVDQFKCFDREKFDYSLVILAKFPGQKDFMNMLPEDLPIYQFDFRSFRSFKEWYKLFKTLKKIKPDVVRSSLFLTNTIIRVFKPLLGYKVIITENNTDEGKGRFKILTDKILSYLTYRITPDSETVKTFTANQENISLDKFQTIYNGVDIDEINRYQKDPSKKDLKTEMGLSADDKIVLNIARLVKQKNQKLLVEAFSHFSKQHPNYKLIIVGDGGLMPELEQQVKDLGISDKVFLPGANKDLYQYYSITDLFVISSTREGFCLTAVMALAFGIPVVSTRVAGLVEYLKDNYNGLFSSYDPKDMASKMSTLAQLDEFRRKEYDKNCRETADRFDIKKQAKAFEDLFLASLKE